MTTTDTTTTGTPLSIPALRDERRRPGDRPRRCRVRPGPDRHVRRGPDDRPAVIVKVANVDDVVAWSRSRARPASSSRSAAAVTAGQATASVDGGIVLDLADMKAIDIDVEGRTVWAESGLTAAELSQALDAHGLALGFGDTGSVGIGGITLGGGVGYLVRKHGLTIDDLLAAEIVTADGELLQVDAEHRARTCSGRSAAAAATSASSPASSTGSTLSAGRGRPAHPAGDG